MMDTNKTNPEELAKLADVLQEINNKAFLPFTVSVEDNPLTGEPCLKVDGEEWFWHLDPDVTSIGKFSKAVGDIAKEFNASYETMDLANSIGSNFYLGDLLERAEMVEEGLNVFEYATYAFENKFDKDMTKFATYYETKESEDIENKLKNGIHNTVQKAEDAIAMTGGKVKLSDKTMQKIIKDALKDAFQKKQGLAH